MTHRSLNQLVHFLFPITRPDPELPIFRADPRESQDQELQWLLSGEEVKMKEDHVGYQSSDGKVFGSAWVTNYRLRFQQLRSDIHVDENVLDVPLGSISKVQKMGHSNMSRGEDAYGILIKCKDMRKIVFIHNPENHSRRELYDKLRLYAFPNTNKMPFFANVYRGDYHYDGWRVFDTRTEFVRQGLPSEYWDLTTINDNYEFSPTYPALLALPLKVVELGDSWIAQAAEFRSRKRLPVLSWYDRRTRVSICRGSQPLVGVNAKRSAHDEMLLKMIADANPNGTRLVILDARPQLNAAVNRAKGGGYENNYRHCDFFFVGIENIHEIRESLKRVKTAVYPHIDMNSWLKTVESTHWLNHVQTILSGAKRALVAMIGNKQSVFIHCSDGWDRTAQLTSLAMLQMDPYYRTLVGFIVLIEKEWCSFGHKFAHRIGHGQKKHKDDERSPIFVQFIDCVWQLYNQFPNAFEFNDDFLKTILDELYACKFGTFLYNSERERTHLIVKTRTISMWSSVLEDRRKYLNPTYSPFATQDPRIFLDGDRPFVFRLWVDYYGRYNPQILTQEFLTHYRELTDNDNNTIKPRVPR